MPGNELSTETSAELGTLASNAASDWKSSEDVEHMVLNMLNSSVTPGMGELVAQIGNMIENDMKPKVLKEHNDTVALLEELFAAFKNCTTDRSTAEEKGDLGSLKDAAGLAKTDVDSCENEKKPLDDQAKDCNETLPVLKGLKESDCKAQEEAEKNPDAMICDPTVADSYETWIERLETFFKGELDNVAEKVVKCDNATKDHDKKKEECGPITDDVDKKTKECDDKDDDRKGKLCAFYTTVKNICNSYGDCNEAARLAYTNAVAKIVVQVADRKVEWETLERIKCLLGAFGTSEDGTTSKSTITACRTAEHDTSHLDITFHDLPDPDDCMALLGDVRTEAEMECPVADSTDSTTGFFTTTMANGYTTANPYTTATQTVTLAGTLIRYAAFPTKCLGADLNLEPPRLVLQDCQGSASQLFELPYPGNTGSIKLARFPGFCLKRKRNEILFVEKGCHRWSAPKGGVADAIRSGNNPSMCLDVPDGLPNNGVHLQLWNCLNNDAQTFLPSAPASSKVYIKWTGNLNKCLDISEGRGQNGANLQMWDCIDGNQNQMFTLPSESGPIQWFHKCLDVASGNTDNGANIQIWDCLGNANQNFLVSQNADAEGQIIWTASTDGGAPGKCFDVAHGKSDNGVNIASYDCAAGSPVNRIFKIVPV